MVKGLKDVIGEAREAQKVGALTAQVIKSTGGAANVTAGQVGKLATAISNKTGIDDEAIQKGSNLLLTFKNVRNEAGKGADMFNQATKAAVDLSAAGFGSIDSASKMLGKALNDPVKGMTALGRAGVTFTAGQKKQIKALVKSGDLLGAQKIILGEVKSQVGGAAAASATAGEKMKTAWNNAKESFGTALLPAIDKLQVAITTKIIPAIVEVHRVPAKEPGHRQGVRHRGRRHRRCVRGGVHRRQRAHHRHRSAGRRRSRSRSCGSSSTGMRSRPRRLPSSTPSVRSSLHGGTGWSKRSRSALSASRTSL